MLQSSYPSLCRHPEAPATAPRPWCPCAVGRREARAFVDAREGVALRWPVAHVFEEALERAPTLAAWRALFPWWRRQQHDDGHISSALTTRPRFSSLSASNTNSALRTRGSRAQCLRRTVEQLLQALLMIRDLSLVKCDLIFTG